MCYTTAMAVQSQPTPNPNAMKFVLAQVRFARPLSFANVSAAATDPLAAQLFTLDGVYNVFMAQDFITINKLPSVDWVTLERQIRPLLEQFEAQREK